MLYLHKSVKKLSLSHNSISQAEKSHLCVTELNYPQYPLGCFPEEWFEEEVPCQFIKDFQKDIEDLSHLIDKRNARLELPYTFLNPKNVDNSVAL